MTDLGRPPPTDLIGKIRDLCSKGFSYVQVMKELEMTKGRLSGLCSRNGITFGYRKVKSKQLTLVANHHYKITPIPPVSSLPPPKAHPKGSIPMLHARNDQCVWIIGEPRDQYVCGDPIELGRPYCNRHTNDAYQEVKPHQQNLHKLT